MNQQKRVSFTGLRRLYEDTPDKGNSGSTMKRIGTGLLAILVLAVLAVGYKVYQAPWALSVFGTAFKAGYQFGSPVAISLDNRQLVTVTVYRPKVPGDSAGRAHYARNVAAFVYDRFPQAPGDSIKQLAVELRGVKTYRLTPAQIKDTTGTMTMAANTPESAPNVSQSGATTSATKTAPVTKTKGAPAAAAPAKPLPALARIRALDPAVTWARNTTLVGDVDCDNAPDTLVAGWNTRELHVGLARTRDAIPQVLVFDSRDGAEFAAQKLRATAMTLALEGLDFEPAERGLAPSDGLARSQTCKGVVVGDPKAAAVHLVWSNKTQHLEWYRGRASSR